MQSEILKNAFQERRWLNWKWEERDGKKTKVPYKFDGTYGSSTDEATWASFDRVNTVRDNFSGIGIVLKDTRDVVVVDLDHVITDGSLNGEYTEEILDFLDKSNSYTEISPSGTGLHTFFKVSSPFEPKAKKSTEKKFEVYTSGRFMTVTENVFFEEKEIRTVSVEEMEFLLSLLGYPWKYVEYTESNEVHVHTGDFPTLEKIFSSKNGDAIKALYNGDASRYNNDDSSADLALCNILAFWFGKDYAEIERVWMSSPLGSREKTQKRSDYRASTINKAIQSCKDVYSSKSIQEHSETLEIENLGLLSTQKKVREEWLTIYPKCLENAVRLFIKHPYFAGRFRFDEFKQENQILKDSKWDGIEDEDYLDIQCTAQTLYNHYTMYGTDMIRDAVTRVCRMNSMDSLMDLATSFKWDGVPRIDSFITNAYGTPDDVYNATVGRNFLMGIAARMLKPGCAHKFVLILEGEQDAKKSKSFRELIGDALFLEDAPLNVENISFFMSMWGKVIVEFSEGAIFSKVSMGKIKGLVSTPIDTIVKKWGRNPVSIPRRCVFVITTNHTQYIDDHTGAVRFFPVSVKNIDIDYIKKNRSQLFAEAVSRVQGGEKWWEEDKEVIKVIREQQQSRSTVSIYEEVIDEWIGDKRNSLMIEEGFATKVFFEKIDKDGNKDLRNFQPGAAREVSMILKKKGFTQVLKRVEGIVGRYWILA